MVDREKIDRARKTLDLGKTATIPEIKEAYRSLSQKYHPDKCPDRDKKKCEEKIKAINAAKEVLIEYCLNYRFQLEDAEDNESSEERQMNDHMKRFYDGWWGEL